MNGLLRLRKDMVITGIIPFKYLLYATFLSDVIPLEEDGVKYGIFSRDALDLYSYYSEWHNDDLRRSELKKALDDLQDEGLVYYDEHGRIFLGEFRGRKFFTFEVKNSLFDKAKDLLFKEIDNYIRTKPAKGKSRGRYIKDQIEQLMEKGVDNMTPGDFTDLHSYLYELYTGGEIYILRNKVESFQTNNMLKAYDRFTVFTILVEGTLKYDSFRKKGVPTITNVACMKDDVFGSLTKTDSGSKEYMREIISTDDSEF